MPRYDTPLADRRDAWSAAAFSLDAGPPLADAHAIALRQGFVLLRAQARSAGVADGRIRSMARAKRWSHPRRGIICVLPPGDDSAIAAALAASAASLARPRSVISHGSAATVHGLPLLVLPHRPMLTVPVTSDSNTRSDIDLHAAQLPAGQITSWYGRPITSIARTVVDIARNRGVTAGVVACDAALHEDAATTRELLAIIESQDGWPYIRRARKALDLADGASESVLETLVRVCVVTRGLPPPALQRWVETDRGAYRVDLLWPEMRVIVEADGLLKYRAGWDAVVAEKLRQEAIERAGYTVVRIGWTEALRDPDAVAARVGAALTRNRRAFRSA